MVNLHGLYYLTPKFGIRTGLSYTCDITDDCDWMIKVPALFSFRSETLDGENIAFDTCETIGEYLAMSLLTILPKRFGLNARPSFVYMNSYRKFSEEEKLRSDNYFINTKPIIALDANAKMTISINRVGIDLSLG